MSQENIVMPEPYEKVCMALAALSLLTIAVCQVVVILRPPAQPIVRRPVMPIQNRVNPQGLPPLPQGTMPYGAPDGARFPKEIHLNLPRSPLRSRPRLRLGTKSE